MLLKYDVESAKTLDKRLVIAVKNVCIHINRYQVSYRSATLIGHMSNNCNFIVVYMSKLVVVIQVCSKHAIFRFCLGFHHVFN